MNRIVLTALLSLSTAVVGPFTFAASKPNVLFIAVDDLRPELGCYGVKEIKSPQIDQLAADGVRFDRAYTQVPVCGSARASLMTGLRPTAQRFSGSYDTRADKETPGVPDLTGWFKQHGYRTYGIGKIYHHADDNKASWTAYGHPGITRPGFMDYQLTSSQPPKDGAGKWGLSHEAADAPDSAYNSYEVATAAINRFKEIKASGRPGFVAMGLMTTHLPFVAPKKYWDLYDRDAIPPSPNPFRSKNAPDASVHNSGELRNYSNVPKGKALIPPDLVKALRHGYYASVSFADAQIGRVLDALEELGLRENTIVVLWSDHGYFLNDHAMWNKHALYSRAMRVPLIISAPGAKPGSASPALVELVDLFPTLCDLAGLPKPGHLEGTSMAPLLAQPDRPWKSAAFSRWFAGASLITDRYTYAEWPNGPRMLYDLQRDPFETENIADTPEGRAVADELSAKLAAGWKPIAAEVR